MVIRLVESIAAVCGPDLLHGDSLSRVCTAVYESNRYFIYATEALVVILVENHEDAAPDNPRAEARRLSQFDLWQVLSVQDATVHCVRFNMSSKKLARGAIALCIDEGRGVLLMPRGSSTSTSTPRLAEKHAKEVRNDYMKAHLDLQLPTWRESVRWKCEDRRMDRLEWVDSGEDLFLVGAGEKISIWKIVDDTVQVYFQRSFAVAPENGVVSHFDATQSGRFLATSGHHDRIVKVWMLNELAVDGTPKCRFLAHTRALTTLRWSKYTHSYQTKASSPALGTYEMLFTLDREGNLSIWKETVAPSRTFILWKFFNSLDYPMQSSDWDESELMDSGSDNDYFVGGTSQMVSFGLVDHYWARAQPAPTVSLSEAILDETNVMSGLCLFHYGYATMDDARKNELYNQRMDNVTQLNTKMMGNRSGNIADSHAGESLIIGNATLGKTFYVHLLYTIQENGDLALFRSEFIPFSGVSPRITLLVVFRGLRKYLIDAHVYGVSSSDYKDQAYGSTSFTVEILFQPKATQTYLKLARLKLLPESSSLGKGNGSMSYSVQMCDIGDMCSCMVGAKRATGRSVLLEISQPRSLATIRAAGTTDCLMPVKFVLSNIDGRLDIFRPSSSFRKLEVAWRPQITPATPSITDSVCYEEQSVVFFVTDSKLYAAKLSCQSIPSISTSQKSLATALFGANSGTNSTDQSSSLSMCYVDMQEEADNDEELQSLIITRVPESQKVEWSQNSSIFGGFGGKHPLKPSNDYCMVIGLSASGWKLTVWVFSFDREDTSSINDAQSESSSAPSAFVKLYRKSRVDLPKRLLKIVSVPSLQHFESVFASMDTDFRLDMWIFDDLSDFASVKHVHCTDVASILATAARSEMPKDVMSSHSANENFLFKQLSLSICGRTAILFGHEQLEVVSNIAGAQIDKICILSAFESNCEGIVFIPHKQFGTLLSLEWTPMVTNESNCELVFLSTTTIGVITFDCTQSINKWSVAWSSSRFSARPQKLSSLSRYPHALLSLGTTIASINLQDLRGSGSTSVSSDDQSKLLPAYHPITLMYLLLRGSFQSLETVLSHIQERILEHEEACYLRMADDAQLKALPILPLSRLLGSSTESKNDDERSTTYLSGKPKKDKGFSSFASTFSAHSAPARASDLFATNFGIRSSYESHSSNDRAEMLFASHTYSPASSKSVESESHAGNQQSILETSVFPEFYKQHRESLSFMTASELESFFAIVHGIQKTVSWERDGSRKKDEASLRFHSSLLWSYQQEDIPEKKTESGSAPLFEQNTDVNDGNEVNNRDDIGICTEQVVWAVITDYQNELLQECFPTSSMTWKEMKQLRIPFWIKSVAKLTSFAEKVAQAEYASTRDPFMVAVFYVLLGKTKLLANLFKMANETRIHDLLNNDFSDIRWKNAAIKNAYVLKTKQRYELSAAFFLLGGKVQEAVSVAEHADRTLVLSFLIARLSEKWDLGGDGDSSISGASDFSQSSLTGLSTSLRSFSADNRSSTNDSSSGCKGLCVEFLQTTVWTKAMKHGDIYMCFLVKYFLGEQMNAIQSLLTIPSVDMHCVFDPRQSTASQPHMLYWRAFGQTLLGACEIIRFLRKTIVPMKTSLKSQIIMLQTVALGRLQGIGLNIVALIQQRDFSKYFRKYSREKPKSIEGAALMAVRHQILTAAVGSQVDFLYATFLRTLRASAASKSSTSLSFGFEERLNAEIESAVHRAGNYELEECPETSNDYIKRRVRGSVVLPLARSGRLAVLDFLVSDWNSAATSSDQDVDASFPPFITPVPHFIEMVAEGITVVTSGNLSATSTDHLYTKRVDQVCSELLSTASQLVLWLLYYYSKPADQRSAMVSTEYVRVATASIYSVICICCRYLKSPCCLYRSFSIIFPHKDPLAAKFINQLKEIAQADVCVNCSASRSTSTGTAATTVPGVSSLQKDIPILYQVVQMLQQELNTFVAEVKTNRLQLTNPLAGSLFVSCQYWTLVLMMAVSIMPSHISKVAVDGSPLNSAATQSGKNLAQVWSTYNAKLSQYATKYLLCDLADSYFRPFALRSGGAEARATETAASSSSTNVQSGGGTSAASTAVPPSPSSPQRKVQRDTRQLLRCPCDRCPWLLILKMFTDKDELLLRLNAQLECCSQKITEKIKWGHLPEIPSKKALTRSQKILLSNAAGKATSATRAADLVEMFEKRMQAPAPPTVNVQCIYRSEAPIKSMTFNCAVDTAEMILCGSKGISRTACVDYSDGSKFQFKGMYANPQTSFFPEGSSTPTSGRRTLDNAIIGSGTPSGSPSSASLLSSPGLSDMKAPSFKPTDVESHPFLPLFVSGSQKGQVHLWSYDTLSVLCSFQTQSVVTSYLSAPTTSGRRDIKKIQFDSLGQQMGVVNKFGSLFLWKFANLDRDSYYREIECHDKGAKGLKFLNSSSCVATVGTSSEKRSVCVWDTLLPLSKALIAAPVCHPAGAASVTFSSTHQLLISGGEGGSISVFDMRQRRVLHTISNAHETAIKTLELHPSGHCVLSGSASGDVKIWSLPIFREVFTITKVHAKPSFLGDAASNILGDAASNMAINVTNSSWGVTDAAAADDYFFTSGTDGSVQRFKVPSLPSIL